MKLTQRQFRMAQISQKHNEIPKAQLSPDNNELIKQPISDSQAKVSLPKSKNQIIFDNNQNASECRQIKFGSPTHFHRKLVQQNEELTSPKMLSPKYQGQFIQYLQKQNEMLLEENQQKQKLIDKLLIESNQNSNKISKIQSPRLLHQQQQPPRTVETKKVTNLVTRLPQIKTPQPQLKHRIETKETALTSDESPTLYQCFSNGAILNQQNWSFGKQLNFDDEQLSGRQKKIEQKPFNGQLTFSNKDCPNFVTNLNQKTITQQSCQVKTNFSKPLLKLPQEFHLSQMKHYKKQLQQL